MIVNWVKVGNLAVGIAILCGIIVLFLGISGSFMSSAGKWSMIVLGIIGLLAAAYAAIFQKRNPTTSYDLYPENKGLSRKNRRAASRKN
jgi:hypothetical protein